MAKKYPIPDKFVPTIKTDSDPCKNCLGGNCCINEDPIYLSPFDILRLCTSFDLPPSRFLQLFTQDWFQDEPPGSRDDVLLNPESSVVTYLRRKDNFRNSPCIFSKLILTEDKVPRRVCAIYDARPTTCRTFIWSDCVKTGTGELAHVLAEAFLNWKNIGYKEIEDTWAKLAKIPHNEVTLQQQLDLYKWTELRRALHMDKYNNDGVKSYHLQSFQHPIDQKIQTMLGKLNKNHEEEGINEIQPYTSPLRLTDEHSRLLRIVQNEPRTTLNTYGDWGHDFALRELGDDGPFELISNEEIKTFLATIPDESVFPSHLDPEVQKISLKTIYTSVLRGMNFLIKFSNYYVTVFDPLNPFPKFNEEILAALSHFGTSLNPFIANNPKINAVKMALAKRATKNLPLYLESGDHFTMILALVTLQDMSQTLLQDDFELAFEIKRANSLLNKNHPEYYIMTLPLWEEDIERRLKLEGDLSAKEWDDWYQMVVVTRFAKILGFDIDLDTFYRRNIKALSYVRPTDENMTNLFNVASHLGFSLSFYNHFRTKDTAFGAYAKTLVDYAWDKLYPEMIKRPEGKDPEMMSEFLDGIHKTSNLPYSYSPHYGTITKFLLDSQLSSGGWQGEAMPECQEDHLYSVYHTTWTVIDGLRPMRYDILDEENAKILI